MASQLPAASSAGKPASNSAAQPGQCQFVKLHGLTSTTGLTLNGTTGSLGVWHENLNGQVGNNRYQVFVGGCSYMIKLENMYAVEPRWIAEVRASPMRKRIGDMMSKFNAPSMYPCPISDLQVLPRHCGGRGTDRQLLQSWWGDKVFRYIRQRMEQQRIRKGQANWDMDYAIQQGTLMLAGVRSDGRHDMQEHPPSPSVSAVKPVLSQFVMVWPTIVFPSRLMSTSYWSYCQGLALMDGASPWIASPDALEIYGPYQTIVDVPTSVQIEELESDSETNDSFELV